ncbi:MAG: CHAT domain-containing protein [Kofleriaceae bacterium]
MSGALVWLFPLLLGTRLADGQPELTCATAVAQATMALSVLVCQGELAETGDPTTARRLADSLSQSGQPRQAEAVARTLLGTANQADGWQLLGSIAGDENRLDEAIGWLELARDQHRALGARGGVARDSLALSTALRNRQQYTEALLALDDCVRESRAASDAPLEYICHLAAQGALAEIGLLEAAVGELEQAEAIARTLPDAVNRERVQLEYMRGNLERELERDGRRHSHYQLASTAYKHAIALNQVAQLSDLAVVLELHLATVLADAGQHPEAATHLAAARLLDPGRAREADELQTEALLAYRRGDLAAAFGLNVRVYEQLDDCERVEIAVMQARIALQDGSLELAEAWAKRGVDAVERIRAKQSTLELRPWILSSRRLPYELRFVALIRAHRVEEALFAFDQWQGRTLLDALTPPVRRGGLREAARQMTQVGTWLSVASSAPFSRVASRAAVTATLRTIDLLALVVADGEVWCVTSRRGELAAHDLGSLAALQGQLDRFITTPTERGLAAELGALFLPDGIAHASTDALRVIVDGPLAALPLAALRIDPPLRGPGLVMMHEDSLPLIALRPVIREPRLPETPCVPARRLTHATVLADAFDDLPRARHEVMVLTSQASLNSTTSLGTDATSDALFATGTEDLLHVAMHGNIDAGSGGLTLHDRRVSALEISARKLRAALVVLAACESGRATGDDLELAGSLASGFLAAGSRQVIATLRVVSDPGAAELVSRFYQAGGLSDATRALASAQAALDDTADTDWPRFAIFGHDVCVATP